MFKVVKKTLKEWNQDNKKIEELIPLGLEKDTAIYVAKLKKGGFIIISADDVATPVLVIDKENYFDLEKLPPGFLYLLEKYQYSVKDLKERKVKQSDKVKDSWEFYLNDEQIPNLKSVSNLSTSSSSSQIETEWN